MTERRFEAEILAADRGGGAWVEIPFDVHQVLGTRGQVRVRATFDGEAYRGSLAPMGGCHVLGISKAIRAAIGKSPGDRVEVVIVQDDAPRTVEVPVELQEALAAHPEAREVFDQLAYTYRKEYAGWIRSAKRPETRQRRLHSAIEKLSRGEKL